MIEIVWTAIKDVSSSPYQSSYRIHLPGRADLALSTLPEELLLRICSYLHRLDDLYAVTPTFRQLARISRDVPAKMVSRMALETGEFLPGLRSLSHFLLISTVRRLSEWARQSVPR